MARLLVVAQALARRLVELRQQVEGDVGRLVVRRIGAGDVVARASRARSRAAAGAASSPAASAAACMPGHQAGGDGFHVAFHARNLAGEEDLGPRAQLQRRGQQRRRVDVGIAMDLPEAQELGVLEAGNQAQDARLLAELQVILEARPG